MKYLIYPNEQSALDRSHEVAVAQGCSGVTQYWFGVSKHPSTDVACMIVDDESLITEAEVGELKDKEYMDANGWFPAPPVDDIQEAEVVQ